MGNSSGSPYSPGYEFRTTPKYVWVPGEEDWMFLEINPRPHDQAVIDYDSDEELEIYIEVCKLLSEDNDTSDDVEWVVVPVPSYW